MATAKEKAAAEKAAAEKAEAEKAAAEKAAADKAEAEKAAADKAEADAVKAASSKSAAGKLAATSGSAAAPHRIDKSERRWFEVSSVVLHDGEEVKPGEPAPLVRADFDQLKAVGIVKGEWEDGDLFKS